MDIQILRTFLELDRTRHFGKAAETLFVTQSAVSARIRLLEETLGVSLFIRRRNEIRLTGAGERLKRHAQTIVAAWQRALIEATLGEEQRSALSVGAVAAVWDCFLQRWINTLYKHRSDVALQAEVYSQEALNKKIMDGGLDVAFLFEPVHIEQYIVSEVASVSLFMVSSRAGLDAHAAMKTGYVMVDWGASFVAVYARHFPEAPQPTIRMNLAHSALAFLQDCGGCGYLPEQLVAEQLRNKRLHLVGGAPVIEQRIYAVYRGYSEHRDLIEETLGYRKETVYRRDFSLPR